MEGNERAAGLGLGLLVGAAIGLALGFMYAPKSGKETREMVKQKANEVADRAGKMMGEARERGKKIMEDAKGKAETGGGNGYKEEAVPLNNTEG